MTERVCGAMCAGLLLALCACDPGAFDALVGAPAEAMSPAQSSPNGPTPPPVASPPATAPSPVPQEEEDAGASPAPAPLPPTLPACPATPDLGAVTVTATEVQTLAIPAVEPWRIGVSSARVGARTVWLFHTPTEVTALWTDAASLLASPPRVRALETPTPLLPSAMDAGGPLTGGVIAISDREALIYYAIFDGWTPRAAGIASLGLDASRARPLKEPGALFPDATSQENPSNAFTPVFFSSAFLDDRSADGMIYVYACYPNPDAPDEQQGGAHEQPCRVARVPATQAVDGASYRYWNGRAWVTDRSAATVIIDHVQGGSLSVSYNPHLGRYLIVHSGAHDNVVLRYADQPYGPFTELAGFDTQPAMGGFGFTHGAQEHAALRNDCGDVTYVSYARPIQLAVDAGAKDFYETRLLRIDLK